MDSIIQTIESMHPDDLAFGILFLTGLTITFIVGAIIWYFLSAIGFRKMYIKAGERGWKAFIPLYRRFICFRFAWNTKLFIPYLIIAILFFVLPDGDSFVMSLITLIVCVAYAVFEIKLNINTAKSFGKTAGCGVLLFFFPFIVSLVLGFGKAEYIGNPTNKIESAE